MAHENHRFNLLLRNGTHPTYNGPASLNPIFSQQSHATHYALFAKFEPRDTAKTHKQNFDVGQFTVSIQNYTGCVTMGLSSVIGINISNYDEEKEAFHVDGFSTGRVVELVVCLQPMHDNFEETVTLKPKQQLQLEQGDLFEVRVLSKLIDGSFSGAGRNRMERTPLILDDKYMYRDGEEIVLEEDIWKDLSTIKILERSGFVVNDETKKNEKQDAKEAIDKENFSTLVKVRRTGERTDPMCKMKSSDIYII